MSAKFFLDTNVLVYSFDRSSPTKQRVAQSLVSDALQDRRGFISYQVAQEFLNVATRKFSTPLNVEEAKRTMHVLLEPLCAVFASFSLNELALEIQAETRFSFYDSLICAAASAGGAKVLYSEDMQHARSIRGVTIQNPFS